MNSITKEFEQIRNSINSLNPSEKTDNQDDRDTCEFLIIKINQQIHTALYRLDDFNKAYEEIKHLTNALKSLIDETLI